MNHFQADWHTLIIGGALIVAAVAATITYWFLEYHRLAREERRYDNVQTDVNNVPLPPWDGEAYDPGQWFADLREPTCEEPPTIAIPVVPASAISGPMPAMPPLVPVKLATTSADDFIASLTEWNDNFLASIGVPGV